MQYQQRVLTSDAPKSYLGGGGWRVNRPSQGSIRHRRDFLHRVASLGRHFVRRLPKQKIFGHSRVGRRTHGVYFLELGRTQMM